MNSLYKEPLIVKECRGTTVKDRCLKTACFYTPSFPVESFHVFGPTFKEIEERSRSQYLFYCCLLNGVLGEEGIFTEPIESNSYNISVIDKPYLFNIHDN